VKGVSCKVASCSRQLPQYSTFGRQWATPTPLPHKPEASMRIVPVVTSPAAGLPLSSSSYIEIGLVSVTVRVYGLVDAKTLGVVLDCLARRA
jgi:hypothetical protein